MLAGDDPEVVSKEVAAQRLACWRQQVRDCEGRGD